MDEGLRGLIVAFFIPVFFGLGLPPISRSWPIHSSLEQRLS
jgi:hypothetical protein